MTLTQVKEKEFHSLDKLANGSWTGEAVALCPQCKAFQSVWFKGSKLVPTRKFSQKGNEIYHDCGSGRPCRLYYSW